MSAVQEDAGRVRVCLFQGVIDVPLFEFKPIEAMQFTQENRPEIERWLDESVELVAVDQEYMVLQNDTSSTLVYEGQYIIRDSVSSLGYTVMGQELFEFRYQQITSR